MGRMFSSLSSLQSGVAVEFAENNLTCSFVRMASLKKKGKKVINQDELRRLMREKQRQTTEKKRVESPFAKYNSLGHLSCVLCNVQVKTDILWQAHVLGKQHKEKVSELKGLKPNSSSAGQAPQEQPLKRKAPESKDTEGKRAKSAGQSTSGLPGDFFEFKRPAEKAPRSTTISAGLSLLAGTYDEDDDDDEEDDTNQKGTTSVSGESAPEGLPADFFDSSIPSVPAVSHSGSILKAEAPEKSTLKKENTAEALPEGFFDDPVRDAKVRNVEAPKDLMDKEWDEFQKEIRQVNTKSEAIVAEDDEEGRLERQIDEIDEQIECYRRVEVLRDKRDVVKSKSTQMTTQELSDQDIEEEDEEELLHLLSRDWRAKGALS